MAAANVTPLKVVLSCGWGLLKLLLVIAAGLAAIAYWKAIWFGVVSLVNWMTRSGTLFWPWAAAFWTALFCGSWAVCVSDKLKTEVDALRGGDLPDTATRHADLIAVALFMPVFPASFAIVYTAASSGPQFEAWPLVWSVVWVVSVGAAFLVGWVIGLPVVFCTVARGIGRFLGV